MNYIVLKKKVTDLLHAVTFCQNPDFKSKTGEFKQVPVCFIFSTI